MDTDIRAARERLDDDRQTGNLIAAAVLCWLAVFVCWLGTL